MRGFYEQFFEVYDIATKLYFFQSIGDDFHSTKIIYNFCRITDNVFIGRNYSIINVNFFLYNMDVNINDIRSTIEANDLFDFYNFINYAKMHIDNIKEAYDEYIANEVCNKLKSS